MERKTTLIKQIEIDEECDLRIKEACSLIENENLEMNLGLKDQGEREYLILSMAWNISKKSSQYYDYLNKHPTIEFIKLRTPVGFLIPAEKIIKSELELRDNVTNKLVIQKNKKNSNYVDQYNVSSNVAYSIDRATNVLSSMYVNIKEEDNKKIINLSKVFSGSENMMAKFCDEIVEAREKDKEEKLFRVKKIIELTEGIENYFI